MGLCCEKTMCNADVTKRDRWISLIAVAAVVGMLVSIFSAFAHYDVVSSEVCTINETFDCDIVNKSSYSEILGIPVSILGLLAYAVLFVGVLVYDRKRSPKLLQLLMSLGAAGLLFRLYLTRIEAFVLYTWCLLCLASQAAILLIVIGLWRLQKEDAS